MFLKLNKTLILIGIFLIVIFLSFSLIYFYRSNFFSSEKIGDFKKVNFITKDGVNIVGNYYFNKEAKFAGILIHQRPLTKESLNNLAKFLNKEGYAVLAIDLRGHGESQESIFGKLNYNKFTPQEEKESIKDIEAASLFLEKEGFSKEKQFLVGASIGANLSFQFLSENPQIKGVILISPGLNYRGIILENFKREGLGNKIFVVVALDDKEALQGARNIKSWYPEVIYLEYPFGGHGINLFKIHQDLQERILNWLREKLI